MAHDQMTTGLARALDRPKRPLSAVTELAVIGPARNAIYVISSGFSQRKPGGFCRRLPDAMTSNRKPDPTGKGRASSRGKHTLGSDGLSLR